MKDFQFPVEFGSVEAAAIAIRVHVGRSHTAQEFINDGFITSGVAAFLRLLSQSKGLNEAFTVVASGERILSFEASRKLIDRAWPIAGVLSLIDAATFLQDMDDDPFITSITVEAGHLPGLSLERAFEDMDRFAADCALQLSPHLGDTFKIDGDIQTDWPRNAEEYFFDIGMKLTPALKDDALVPVRDAFAAVETVLAGSAFEIERTFEALLDEGLVPFPVKAEVAADAIEYSIEAPPSDISIPLVLLKDALKNSFSADVIRWDIQIRDRW